MNEYTTDSHRHRNVFYDTYGSFTLPATEYTEILRPKGCEQNHLEISIGLGLGPLQLLIIIIKRNSMSTGISLGLDLGLRQCKHTITDTLSDIYRCSACITDVRSIS